MAIRPLPISLAFSPNSRGRDPQSLTPAAFDLTTRTKMNWQERPHQKEWRGSSNRGAMPEAEWDKDEC